MRSVSVVTSGGDVAGTWDVPEICRIFQMKEMLAEKVPVDQHLVKGHIDLRGQGFVHMAFGMGKWRGSYHGTEGETHTLHLGHGRIMVPMRPFWFECCLYLWSKILWEALGRHLCG